jgi:KUP system potassium uptake protein
VSPHSSPDRQGAHSLAFLTLAALGVVFGDIGTSPLYAIRESFHSAHSVPVTPANVLGVLSLIFWALVVVISIKYVSYVMRADNQGEGGILALMALVPSNYRGPNSRGLLIGLGLFGSALLYGDGMITPAITVLSAMEGLNVATPLFQPYVVPLTVVILVVLFVVQYRGTASVGAMFGPVMIVWFVVLAALGLRALALEPKVLGAINPWHGIDFFVRNGYQAFVILGSVFLVVTGGEALYADMGHFGHRPIRLAWFGLVQPALMLNYFGQGALLLRDPSAAVNPFFHLSPDWMLLPLVALSTMAAVIASQALISAVFSLTHQAVQLGYCPRMAIQYTSAETMGQIYVKHVNFALMVATIALVLAFRSSTNLAAAYGIAVTGTMGITTVLAYVVSRHVWGRSRLAAGAISVVFLVIDLAFFAANAVKIEHGGWVPLLIGAVIFTLMTTWKRGRQVVGDALRARAYPFAQFMRDIQERPPVRVPGTAVFMTGTGAGTPPTLMHNVEHNKVLHRQIVLLTVTTADVPHVSDESRIAVEALGANFFRVTVTYGFMEEPNVPEALVQARAQGLAIDPADTTYFLGRETLLATRGDNMAIWREKLFVLISRNAMRATAFFKIPSDRVVELGMQLEI